MNTAEPGWLDARGRPDDAARQASRPLLDAAAEAVAHRAQAVPAGARETAGRDIVAIDIGAGTGNSMRWFDRELRARLPGRHLSWVLVDADATALAVAATRHGRAVRTVTSSIASLPDIAAEAVGESGTLIVTGSALLDVLTLEDLEVIVGTLRRFSGVGLFLLSITGAWQLTPAHPDDATLDAAFGSHQRRGGRLGTNAPTTLADLAARSGARVMTSASPWHLGATDHAEVLARFLTERVAAAIAVDPRLCARGREWLAERLRQIAVHELDVRVDHTDVLIDASMPSDASPEPAEGTGR